MQRYLFGLDAGNTVIKAVIFDLDGNEIARASEEGRSQKPKPGFVERDMVELWTNAANVIRTCISKANIEPKDIVGIGCAGHGNGLYALDKENKPVIGIQSIDTRANDLVELWRLDDRGVKARDICGQEPWASQTPTLLSWLRKQNRSTFEKIATAFFVKDYLAFKLTGNKSSDLSDTSGAGLINLSTRRYDRALLNLYDLADHEDIFPAAYESHEIVGHVTEHAALQTGLHEGTPVVAGLFDVVASALGSGVSKTGQASIIAGTWSINQVIVETPKLDSPVFMFSTFDNSRYLAMDNSATSAVNLEWLVTNLFPRKEGEVTSPYDASCALAQAIKPSLSDPIYHPFLYGNASDGSAKASFIGLSGWHSAGHIVRAVLEGVAFGHRQHLEKLRSAGVRINSAIMSGGGSRSTYWPQLFADVLQIPISVANSYETGALGAAIAAGTGVGIFKDFQHGTRSMVRTNRHYEPKIGLSNVYNKRYRLYRDSELALRPLWKRFADTPATGIEV